MSMSLRRAIEFRLVLLCSVAVLAGLSFTMAAWGEDEAVADGESAHVITAADSTEAGDMAAKMAAWMKSMTPGEAHQKLDGFVGSWDITSKMWMDPAMPPMDGAGHSEVQWILGGRYIQETFESVSAMGAFEGLGIFGYSNDQEQYVGFWCDNMSTVGMTFVGSYDESDNTITWSGTHECPINGEMLTTRSVNRFIDENAMQFEMFSTRPGEEEQKVMEVNYVRSDVVQAAAE